VEKNCSVFFLDSKKEEECQTQRGEGEGRALAGRKGPAAQELDHRGQLLGERRVIKILLPGGGPGSTGTIEQLGVFSPRKVKQPLLNKP